MSKLKLLIVFMVVVSAMTAGADSLFAQTNVSVRGVVTSADEKVPLIGVHVVSGDSGGTITDINGVYQITVTAGSELSFKYIGYKDVKHIVPVGSAQHTFDVVMKEDIEMIEEVVVIGYGVRKKGTIAGSVSVVKGNIVESIPTASFDQALQGQVPGLSVMSATGEPSQPAKMKIRGTNSINSGTEPLYILDGTPITSGTFSAMNQSDIESISVLKDASSTSIYGARAANGVIVITTKRGKMSDKPTIRLSTQMGFSQIAHGEWNLMNTQERIQYEKEIDMTEGKNYDLLSKTDVNWLDAIFNDGAMLQNYELSVLGGTNNSNYFVSGGYYKQEGIAPQSKFDRYSVRANYENRSADWLKIGTNTLTSLQTASLSPSGSYYTNTPISAVRMMLPYWDPYKKDGTLASGSDGSWRGKGENPLEWAEYNPSNNNVYKMVSSVFAEANLTNGLILKSQLGVDYSHVTYESSSAPDYWANNFEGRKSRNSSDRLAVTITNTANYTFNIGDKHSFNFLLGQEGIHSNYESFGLTAIGLTNPNFLTISAAPRVKSWTDVPKDNNAYLSFFGRGEYNYEDRYYADFSIRTDGSSRFGKDNRWAFFGSAAFMWNLRNELFMEESKEWLTNAQISLSTGTTGNSEIGNYEHLALVVAGAKYKDYPGIAMQQLGNEKLTWEKVWATNLGFHFSFWKRIDTDIELYAKKTTDMLMATPQPISSSQGFGYKMENVGSMINRGVDFSVNASLISAKSFNWRVFTNVSYNYNRITALYNGADEFEAGNSAIKNAVGYPIGAFYINRFAGVNPANGDQLWYTKDGKYTTEMRDEDKVFVNKSFHAPFEGGFGTHLSWNGIFLSSQFSWVGKRYAINNDRYFEESNGRFASINQSKLLLNRWKKPGDITDIPRHGEYTEFDSRLLENASFLRLKNLMIGYNVPEKMLNKTGFVRGLRLFVQGQNLLTFTKFTGLDPEDVSNIYQARYPMTRQYSFGLDLTF